MKAKLAILILIITIHPLYLLAQSQGRVQKGLVRSQSFVDLPSHPLEGVTVSRKDGRVMDALSNQQGRFELSMENLDNKDNLYYLGDVKSENSDYHLLIPKLDERKQYTPNADLEIVMMSEREKSQFIRRSNEEIASRLKHVKDSLDRYYADLHKKEIIELDSLISVINQINTNTSNSEYLMKSYIEIIANKDYESTDKVNQEASVAIKEGRYDDAEMLLKFHFGSMDSIKNDYIRRDEQFKQIAYDKAEKDRQQIDACDNFIGLALGTFDYQNAHKYMLDRIEMIPGNIDYLLALGELEEIQFNDYPNAIQHYTEALEQSHIQYSPQSEYAAICHNRLGNIYEVLCEFNEAEKHFNQAKEILEANGSTDTEAIFDSYSGLGKVYEDLFKNDKALFYYNECAQPHVAQINNKAYMIGRIGIAQVNYSLGKYKEAKNEFSNLQKELSEDTNPDLETLSKAYYGIAACLNYTGQYQKAIDLCESAVDYISSHTVGNNIYIANIRQIEALSLADLGNLKDSQTCIHQAQATYNSILGENHPQFAGNCIEMAEYYLLIGELKEAKQMVDKALHSLNTKFGKNHFATINAHQTMANIHQSFSEYAEALAEYDTIRSIYAKANLLNEFNRCEIEYNVARIRETLGETKKIIDAYKNYINVIIKTIGPDAASLTNVYSSIAIFYINQLDFNNAKTYIDQCLALADKLYGKESPMAIIERINLGYYHECKGNFTESYKIYVSVEQSMQSIFGKNNYNLLTIYSKLGNYYLSQYQFDKAKSYFDLQYEITASAYEEGHPFMANALINLSLYESYFHPKIQLQYAQDAYALLVDKFGEGHNHTLQALYEICNSYIQLGQFDKAESNLELLAFFAEKGFGKKSAFYANNVIFEQSKLYSSKIDYANAIKYTKKAIEINEKLDGRHCRLTLPLYSQLSCLYEMIGDYHQATDYCDLAISIANNAFGENSIEAMSYLLTKSRLHMDIYRFSEAYEIIHKVKSMFSSYYGKSSFQLCPLLMQEAHLLLNEGYISQGIDTLLVVKQRLEIAYGSESPGMCDIYNMLANAYMTNSQMGKAKYYYEKTLSISESAYGSNSVNCITPLIGLGQIAINAENDMKRAELYYIRAGFIALSVYGADDVNTAITDTYLGTLSLMKGDMIDAYQKFERFEQAIKKSFDNVTTAHPRLADVYSNWGQYYFHKAQMTAYNEQDSIQALNYASQAIENFEHAKQILEMVFGKDAVNTVSVLYTIADVQLFMANKDDAIAILKKAAQISIEWFGKSSPLVGNAYIALADAYVYELTGSVSEDTDTDFRIDQLDKALEYYLKALDIREKTEGNSREFIKSSTMFLRSKIAAIYKQLYEYDEALSVAFELIEEAEIINATYEEEDNYHKNIRITLFNYYINTAGIILESEKHQESALELLTKAQSLLDEVQVPNDTKIFFTIQVLYGFGMTYEALSNIQDSIVYYEQALNFMKSNNHNEDQINMLQDKIDELRSNY